MKNDMFPVPEVIVHDQKCMATSLNVASVFGKAHKNVLRDIEQVTDNWKK